MRDFSLNVGDVISLPEDGLTLEVMDIDGELVYLGISAP